MPERNEILTTQILREIKQRKVENRPFLVALDGRCASGKTTLAAHLQAVCGCGVVHLDDFFLRPEQRTQERYATPGENIDHERFLSEVLLPLRRGEAAEYRPYDCAHQTLGDPIRVEPSSVVVTEGSYACHSALWPWYDLRV
ncbi:MAG: uridine kinase, partial [Oscillospiraceae bacterium]